MFSKNKKYKFDRETLLYKKVEKTVKEKFMGFFRVFLITGTIAASLTILFVFAVGSPIEIALKSKIDKIKFNYAQINSKIDTLSAHLQQIYYVNDTYFREILQLDSITSEARVAGMGGSDPYAEISNYSHNDIIASTLKRIDIINSQIKLQYHSYDTILKEAILFERALREIPYIQPVKPGGNIWISSYFGSRTDPFTHLSARHKGMDFAGARNTEIYSTADGVVKTAKFSLFGYGKEVVILHNFGYSTIYGHLNKILVEEGDTVTRGQLIGLMGNTGRSTGTHLHYEVRLNNNPVNPYYLFNDDLSPEEYDLITSRANTTND